MDNRFCVDCRFPINIPLILSVTPEEEMDSDVETCSSPWTRIDNLTGCYHVGADKASWDAAEDACQNLDANAHLASFETDEVSVSEYLTKDLGSRLESFNLNICLGEIRGLSKTTLFSKLPFHSAHNSKLEYLKRVSCSG